MHLSELTLLCHPSTSLPLEHRAKSKAGEKPAAAQIPCMHLNATGGLIFLMCAFDRILRRLGGSIGRREAAHVHRHVANRK